MNKLPTTPGEMPPPQPCAEDGESSSIRTPSISGLGQGHRADSRHRDALTGLPDRNVLDEALHREVAHAKQRRIALSLLLLSVDGLRAINDARGRQVGDLVLQLVAKTIDRLMRPGDLLARFGGARFAIVIRDSSTRNLEILAHRACRRVAELCVEPNLQKLAITISAGAARVEPDDDGYHAEALVDVAEAALHEAENAGGDRFRVAASLGAAKMARLLGE